MASNGLLIYPIIVIFQTTVTFADRASLSPFEQTLNLIQRDEAVCVPIQMLDQVLSLVRRKVRDREQEMLEITLVYLLILHLQTALEALYDAHELAALGRQGPLYRCC